MSELDPEEEAVLERARRALTPPRVVTNRMRAALLAKLAAPSAAAAAAAAAATGAGTAAGTPAQLVEGVTDTALASGSVATGAKVAASGGAVATGAKVAASGAGVVAAGTKLVLSAAVLKAVAGVTTAAVLATAAGYYWSPRQEAPPTAALAPTQAPTPAPGPPAAPAHRTPRVVTPAPGLAPGDRVAPPEHTRGVELDTAQQRESTQPPPSASSQQLLQRELDALQGVRQALQAGDAPRALRMLAELDAKQPVSPLSQEREVARVLALCGTGQVTRAREVAQGLLGPNPNSLYAERIRASCAATSVEPRVPAKSPAPSSQGPAKSTKVAPPVARFGDSGN